MATTDSNHRSALDRFLGVFTDVHAGEGFTALLLALNVFLILMAYYILKPVREALILGEGSAELKTYMSAGQVVVLAFVVPMYAKLVAESSADALDQHGDGILHRLPGRVLLPRAGGRAARDPVSSSGLASSA